MQGSLFLRSREKGALKYLSRSHAGHSLGGNQ